jgi:D-sedoheptulose 7-phosphate isomerase
MTKKSNSNFKAHEFANTVEYANNLKLKLLKQENNIKKIINKIHITLKKGKKIFICGNGGSAADAQHLAAEFLIRLTKNIKRKSYPVIPLALDTSTLTACGNDLGFDQIFSRTLEGLGNQGDTLIVISTSGNSKNILRVLKEAKKKKISSIGLLGNNGGKCKTRTDLKIIVPSKNTARIQECHIFLGHIIFSAVEKKLVN